MNEEMERRTSWGSGSFSDDVAPFVGSFIVDFLT